MKASTIVIWAMVLIEIGTNAHAFFPPAFVDQVEQNGVIVQMYNEKAIDPWTVRMVSLSLASAATIILLSFLRIDKHARSYLIAWALYYVLQAVQKMAGLNVAHSLHDLFQGKLFTTDWPYDIVIMGAFIIGAYLNNRFDPLRIVWRKPQ